MQSLIGVSETLDALPNVRNSLLAATGYDWVAARSQRNIADALVVAVDLHAKPSFPAVKEVKDAVDRGTPIFAVLLPSSTTDPILSLWTAIEGRCVVIEALPDDDDCTQRILDALEDHLCGLFLPSTGQNTALRIGEWLTTELATLGVPDARELRLLATQAAAGSEPSTLLSWQAAAIDALKAGKVEVCLKELRRATPYTEADWSARYTLGRLLTARGHPAEFGEARLQLDRVRDALAAQEPNPECPERLIAIRRASCLLTSVRLDRRRAPDAAQADLANLREVEAAVPDSIGHLIVAEQIRLDGRRGEVNDVVGALRAVLWEGPETAVRLLNCVDLAGVRDLVSVALIDAVQAEMARAANAFVRVAPAERPSTVRSAIDAARDYARESADELREQFVCVEALIDFSLATPIWREDQCKLVVESAQQAVTELENRRRSIVDLASQLRDSSGVAVEAFAPDPPVGAAPGTSVELPHLAGDAEPAAVDSAIGSIEPALPSEQREQLRAQISAANEYRTAKASDLAEVQNRPVPEPTPPGPQRKLIGRGALIGVFGCLLGIAVIDSSFGWAALALLAVALVCLLPFRLQNRRHSRYSNELRAAQDERQEADRTWAALTATKSEVDRAIAIDKPLEAARKRLSGAADHYTSARDTRAQVARRLHTDAESAGDFARFLADRMKAFDEAFAVHPRIWWPNFGGAGDLVCIDPPRSVAQGLLHDWTGTRLVRVEPQGKGLQVSDVRTVFAPDEHARADRLEQFLRGLLSQWTSSRG